MKQIHGSRKSGALARALAVAVIASAIPPAAQGQISNPPALPQELIVFPERDFVVVDGFAPDADVIVAVLRDGTLVADAVGRTDDAGFLEVNHPGGICWRALTPDIVPGDIVQATYDDTPNNILQGLTPGSGAAVATANAGRSRR